MYFKIQKLLHDIKFAMKFARTKGNTPGQFNICMYTDIELSLMHAAYISYFIGAHYFGLRIAQCSEHLPR